MTSVAAPPAEHIETPKRSHRKLWILLVVVLLLLAALGAAAAWLGLGLKKAARDVKADASVAQDALQAFKADLQAGDQVKAAADLSTARRSLAAANVAAERRQVRIAASLPVTRTAVADLHHLLAAAGLVVDAGDKVQKIYGDFSGKDSKLFHDNQFDMAALTSAGTSTREIDAMMARAETDLHAVKGTVPGTSAVIAARDKALAQVVDLRTQIAALRPILDVMPAAVGAHVQKRYMIALLNPAEMRGTGGAPLSGAVVQLNKGKLSFIQKGAFSVLTTAGELPGQGDIKPWNWTSSNPYRAKQHFANSNENPDFPVSGEEMRRSWKAATGVTTNGVIALDAAALADLLRATGPVQAQGFGVVTADNFVQKVLVDAYRQYTDPAVRQAYNQDLINQMVSRLTQGGGLLGKAKAMAAAVPGRHLQAYFQDPALQKLSVDKGLSGSLAPDPKGDYVASFTQNSNGSKVDVFQQRTMKVHATVRPDGGANVTQVMTITNAIPDGVGPAGGANFTYLARNGGSLASIYVPKNAHKVVATGDGQEQRVHTDVAHRLYVFRNGIELKPGETAKITVSYRLPAGTFSSTGGGLRYTVTSEPSNIPRTPVLAIRVTAPAGYTIPAQGTWKVVGPQAALNVPMDSLRTTTLELAKG